MKKKVKDINYCSYFFHYVEFQACNLPRVIWENKNCCFKILFKLINELFASKFKMKMNKYYHLFLKIITRQKSTFFT